MKKKSKKGNEIWLLGPSFEPQPSGTFADWQEYEKELKSSKERHMSRPVGALARKYYCRSIWGHIGKTCVFCGYVEEECPSK